MNAFLLNQIAHMENFVSTHGAVTNVCAVMVDTEATVSTVSASTHFALEIKNKNVSDSLGFKQLKRFLGLSV